MLNLIERLPGHSHFYAAIAMDEEYAEMIVEAQEREKKEGKSAATKSTPGGPAITTWTPEVNVLATVADRLAVLIEIQKGKPGQPVQYPRPKTALDKVRYRRAQQQHEAIVAQVLPQKADTNK